MPRLLDDLTLQKLHIAAISTGLAGSRAALLGSIHSTFVAGLPDAPNPAAQLLLDLSTMNDVGVLADGSVPLRSWLSAAKQLAGPRRESSVFAGALQLIDGSPAATPQHGDDSGADPYGTSRPHSNGDSTDIACLTALGLEHAAVMGFLVSAKEVVLPTGTIVEVGELRQSSRKTRVAVVQGGQGNSAAAAAGQEIIAHFRPKIVLMVGVAGGIKDVRVGDVVAATKVYGYESGKAMDEFLPRPDLGLSSYRLVQRAMHEALRTGWLKRLGFDPSTDGAPTALVGPIAAGSAVVASTRAPIYQFLRKQYGDALAVEMEGRGFLEAAYRHKADALVVRGISDLIDGKSAADAGGSQPVAARNAAAFALEVAEKTLG
jgi:nucleoside phosphorylase